MDQSLEASRNRAINLIIGIILAAFHLVSLVFHLKYNWRFDSFSGTAVIESSETGAIGAGCVAFVVTLAVLLLAARIRPLPPILMVLIGNHLCPIVFFKIFERFFSSKVLPLWTASSGIPDPRIILSELLKMFAVNSCIGLIAGLFLSMLLAALFASHPKVEYSSLE